MTATLTEPPSRPAALHFGLELPRSVAEYALFIAAEPLLHLAPTGDGHPVLVLPGFLADDRSTFGLRRLLRGLGSPPPRAAAPHEPAFAGDATTCWQALGRVQQTLADLDANVHPRLALEALLLALPRTR